MHEPPRILRMTRWYLIGIMEKYKTAMIAGIIIGLLMGFSGKHLYEITLKNYSKSIERVGIVGIYTIDSLPPSIEQKISLGLTKISTEKTAEPSLAYAWEATDSGKTYIFKLRHDYVWKTGKNVTAYDVNYQIHGVTFTPLDTYTLKAELLSPFTPFPILLSRPIFISGVLGCGLYDIESIKRKGEQLNFLRLAPRLPSEPLYEYRFYTTEKEAITAFKQGDIDTIENLSDPGDLLSWNTVIIMEKPDYDRMVSVYFNMKKPEFNQRQLRQAFGYMLPVIPAERVYSPIPSNSWAYSDKIKKFESDVTHASTLLKEANAPDDLTLVISTFPQFVSYAELLKESFQKLNITVNLSVIQSIPNDFQILLTSQNIPPDPDQYILWHSTQINTNITGYSNAKVDKLLEDGRIETDMTTRKQIYADFQKYLVEDAPVLFWFHPTMYSITRKHPKLFF